MSKAGPDKPQQRLLDDQIEPFLQQLRGAHRPGERATRRPLLQPPPDRGRPHHYDWHLAVFPLAFAGRNNISSGADPGFTCLLSTGAHNALERDICGKRGRRRGADGIAGSHATPLSPEPSDFRQ